MTEPGVFGPVSRERTWARQQLESIRARLEAGTATSADHRPALDAVLVLPREEAEAWIEEIRLGFIEVYARERESRRTTSPQALDADTTT
ncbi:MAG TPA: hypothetical protein VI076_06410 [Actinopolymorphaceae bacterium]